MPGPSPRTVARLLRLLLALWPLVFASDALAADPAPAGTTVPSDPVFRPVQIDGPAPPGRIRQLGPGGLLTLVDEGGQERSIPLARLVKLTRTVAAAPASHDGPLVLLPGGDRLRAREVRSDDDAFRVQPSTTALGDQAIPIDRPLGLILNGPTSPDLLDELVARIRDEPRTSEVAWLVNGDRVTGGFLGLGPEKLAFQGEAGKVELDRGGVVALGFDPALAAYPAPEGLYLELTLTDGSRLGVTEPRVERGRLIAKSRYGASLSVPLDELAGIHVLGGAVAYLADRPDAIAQYQAYVGPTRPFRRDATVDGHPFLLAGVPYDRGLGTQSRTLLAYRLRPGDLRFQATIGLDDRAGALGGAVFRVLVDKKVAFVSPPMAAGEAPKEVDVDLAGARSLILVTEFGPRGEIRDLADWVEARLIR